MIGQQTKNILRIALAYLYRYDAPIKQIMLPLAHRSFKTEQGHS